MLAPVTNGMRALAIALVLFAGSATAALPPAESLAVAPKVADVRPKDYTIDGALALGDDVGYQFFSTGGPVRLDIGSVTNESTTRTSGTVRVGLFVTRGPDGNEGTYWTIAATDLGTLAPGARFNATSPTATYFAPPDGTYYLHMGAFEYEPATCGTSTGFCLDDFVTFRNQVQVSGGQIFDAGPPPAPRVRAVEYYHAAFNHYFLTAFPNEIRLLDAGAFQGWQRTGGGFDVWSEDSDGLLGVCRFFSASFAPKSSHFYTPFADECAIVRGNPNWQYEAIAFYVGQPDANGNCPIDRRALYRLYNNGMSGAPNHRYTTSLDVRLEMVGRGWISEGWGPRGTIACVPL